MGVPAQNNNQQAYNQVYYEPDTGQYFTYEKLTPENSIFRDQKAANFFSALGMYGNTKRNYLGNSLMSQNDRFKTNAQATPYAELTNLFPSLNNNAQSLLDSTNNTESSGVGRFLSSNTQSK